jgi:hypothetical protein
LRVGEARDRDQARGLHDLLARHCPVGVGLEVGLLLDRGDGVDLALCAGRVLLRREGERACVVRQRGHQHLLLWWCLQGEDGLGRAEERVGQIRCGLDGFQHRELRDYRVGQRCVELARGIDRGRAVAAHLRRDQHEVDIVWVVGRLVHRVRGRGAEVPLVDGHRALVDFQRLLVQPTR